MSATLTWEPAARERMQRIPAFVRGMVTRAVETWCEKNDVDVVTAEVLEVIGELRAEGKDFVLVTHEMGFARAVSDRVAFLSEGRVIEAGTPAEVFDAPREEITKAFLARILRY